ncbi:hypothetical protein ACWD4B_11980 [Streptomyces sp. NPDC002536]
MSHYYARKKDARRRQDATGQQYHQALADVREDRYTHLDRVERGDYPAAAVRDDDPVPLELRNLVRHHANCIARYLHQALSLGRYYSDDFGEWQRNGLRRLTDAQDHLFLLIGTITAYLQEQHVSPDRLRMYLDVRDHQAVQKYFTPQVRQHLDGLTGKPVDGSESFIHHVGQGLADGSWSEPAFEDTLSRRSSPPCTPTTRTTSRHSTICRQRWNPAPGRLPARRS